MNHAHVLLAAGWVALTRGDRDRATSFATDAAADAGVRRDRGSLAESLELRALASRGSARDVERLGEAAAIWRELGDPASEARAQLEAALLVADNAGTERAEAALAAVGARGYRSSLALMLPQDSGPAVVVQALGRFRVLRSGEPVPPGAWQSRKARELLKILVTRRGRPTPREVLMEALWPEQSPAPLGNRLSVLLSTVRGVLDPAKRYEPDHFVGADKGSVWLQPDTIAVDVERFLADAHEALALYRAASPEAQRRLSAAEGSYTGDLLEEDAYEDWSIALREEVRTTYIEVVRALADLAARAGDADATTRYALRVLERDPYDEQAHLGLVTALEAAGRHGEARRCYRSYCARMDEIGVESAPFPASGSGLDPYPIR
jgi:DNA-binding SARP family transcriptional activator